ncbi:MAG TPA: YqiA/YcfP family alpha/beta fold hydrolase [Kofleriaceae bacterium]|nr:YqiA/YcfP family alpha/beta fold hydrolase [Kofleriaceae bacterium]
MNILYGHGFASGPRSTKGLAFEAHFAAIGVAIDRLDLRVPSLEHLRLSAMIDTVRAAITDQAIVIGSSLGGLTAARAAERDPRIVALVLMAPAFQLIARWRQRPDWEAWQRTGWLAIHDFAENKPARVDIGFADDAAAIDIGYPDVRVPTLIFHGNHDDAVSIERSREFVAGNQHARLVELDDGHDLIASVPVILDETNRFLRPWLE